jgi:hypothetical protein
VWNKCSAFYNFRKKTLQKLQIKISIIGNQSALDPLPVPTTFWQKLPVYFASPDGATPEHLSQSQPFFMSLSLGVLLDYFL